MIKPVYIVSGLLDSGKTSVIKETLLNPNFNEGERTLIICFEEGEEEFDKAFLKASNSFVIYLDGLKELDLDKMNEIEENEEFDRIFIEINGTDDEMPLLLEGGLHQNWEYAQSLCICDASQFRNQVNNLRTFFYYHIKCAECIIFNRFDDDNEYPFIRNNVLGLNPGAELIFEDSNHEIVDFRNYEFFDLNQEHLDISDINYGVWYVDAANKAIKYENKHITINVKCLEDLPDNKTALIMGREAMICCADDIASMGITCVGVKKEELKKDEFYLVSGTIHTVMAEDGFETCILYVDKIEPGRKLDDPLVYFN